MKSCLELISLCKISWRNVTGLVALRPLKILERSDWEKITQERKVKAIGTFCSKSFICNSIRDNLIFKIISAYQFLWMALNSRSFEQHPIHLQFTLIGSVSLESIRIMSRETLSIYWSWLGAWGAKGPMFDGQDIIVDCHISESELFTCLCACII